MDQHPFRFHNRFGPKKKIVLFICTGDTCRSPMAAGYLRKLLQESGDDSQYDVRSAGVMTVTGLRASQEAHQIMENAQIDLARHRSSQLSQDMIRRADLILGMSPLHVQTALRMSDEAREKTHLFKEFAKHDLKNAQITDPMGCTLEVFKKCFLDIRMTCEKLITTEFFGSGAKKSRPAKAAATSETARPDAREPATVSAKPKTARAAGKSPKKAAAKKTAPKKTAPKKSAPKKKAPKKKAAAARKSPAKKSAPKKSAAAKKKSSARGTAIKSGAAARKKAVKRKAAPRSTRRR